jgi:quinol monooxygenase YgiN
MTMLLQATATIEDFEQLRDGLKWLSSEVGHPEGFLALRIFRAQDDPARVTMLEEWESPEAFQRSFETYSLEQRGEFLSRLGLSPDAFDRAFWLSTDLSYD